MIDRYTKIMLTVIAASLVAIVVQNFVHAARAQALACGAAPSTGCWVQSVPKNPLWIAVNPKEPKTGLRAILTWIGSYKGFVTNSDCRAVQCHRGTETSPPSPVPAADRPQPWSGTVSRSSAHRPELAVALLARISCPGMSNQPRSQAGPPMTLGNMRANGVRSLAVLIVGAPAARKAKPK